jgi:hypothetical protein
LQGWSDELGRYGPRTLSLPVYANGRQFEPAVILLAVGWYLRFSLSYRDVEALLAERGIKPLSSLSARNSLPRVRGGTESSRTITPSQYEREKDDGTDNEIDGEAAIKLYDELVKSPEDRLALEKEIPSLIAARDKAVTAVKQLQKETVQIPNHVAKMRR